MGFRFRQRIHIAPGVTLNVNRKSVGMTVGRKGMHYTVNSRGRRTTSVGMPGTGVSYQYATTGKRTRRTKTMARHKRHWWLLWLAMLAVLALPGIAEAQPARAASVLGRWNAQAADFGVGFRLVSRHDTAVLSTVVYVKTIGHFTYTGAATIRAYMNATIAQDAVLAAVQRLVRQGDQKEMPSFQGQMSEMLIGSTSGYGGQTVERVDLVFAEGRYLVTVHYADSNAFNAGFVVGKVASTIDLRIAGTI